MGSFRFTKDFTRFLFEDLGDFGSLRVPLSRPKDSASCLSFAIRSLRQSIPIFLRLPVRTFSSTLIRNTETASRRVVFRPSLLRRYGLVPAHSGMSAKEQPPSSEANKASREHEFPAKPPTKEQARKKSAIVNFSPLCQTRCERLTTRPTSSKSKSFGQQTSEHSRKQRYANSTGVYLKSNAWLMLWICFKDSKKIPIKRISGRLKTGQCPNFSSGTSICRRLNLLFRIRKVRIPRRWLSLRIYLCRLKRICARLRKFHYNWETIFTRWQTRLLPLLRVRTTNLGTSGEIWSWPSYSRWGLPC